MSEKILKALMQLFALIGNSETDGSFGRNTVEFFLKQQLNKEQANEYLAINDQDCKKYHELTEGEEKQKKTAVSSVKVLVICKQINRELNQKQKLLVLLRLIEFVKTGDKIGVQESEFVSMVSSSFHIPEDEYAIFLSFILNQDQSKEQETADILIVNNQAQKS